MLVKTKAGSLADTLIDVKVKRVVDSLGDTLVLAKKKTHLAT